MEQEIKSEGKCLFCEQIFSQNGIGKHLAKHLAEMEKTDVEKNGNNYCHVCVDANEMFLHLLVKGSITMKSIDTFLRDIWLECCGHLSNFGHNNFEVGMSNHAEDIFQSKVKIYHEYDYGDTTRIDLRAMSRYCLNLNDNIVLLSRNEPLNILCGACKKQPAVNICTVCNYDEYSFFCERCSDKHAEECDDFSDYANMPVVNSPRMGICGYTGGVIDKERDGTYQIR